MPTQSHCLWLCPFYLADLTTASVQPNHLSSACPKNFCLHSQCYDAFPPRLLPMKQLAVFWLPEGFFVVLQPSWQKLVSS